MQTKILLISLSVAVFSSCSTTYKSGQTPDDVYFSPVRIDSDDQKNDNRDEVKNDTREDNTIRMRIRDHRWKEFDDDRDYRNSPYHYCTCNCDDYGYYYNPYYHPWPIYLTKVTPVHFTPRMVNLNAYTGYNSNAPVINPKAGNNNTGINWIKPTGQYSNSNNGSYTRQVINPSRSSSSSNSNRTYSPSSSNKSSSNSSSSSSGSSRSGSISRPKRD